MSGDKEAREGEDLYILRASFMRYVRTVGFNRDTGRPILEPKRYEQGDQISLTEEEAERYLRSGAMVKAEGYDPEAQAEDDAERRAEADKVLSTMAATPTRAGQVGGQLVGLEDADADEKKSDAEEPVEVDGIVVEDIEDVKQPEDEVDPDAEPQDPYADMGYPDLVQTAKSRGLNGGGSKEELRARLRESDAQQ